MNYPVDPKTHKHNHAEAFCLMFYQNDDTKRWFWVWNSRDGVTPFCAIENGVEYRHNNFSWDKYLPSYQLLEGERFFRDTTPNEAAYIALQRMNHYQGTEYEIERGSDEWYKQWARVTESIIGQPLMDKFSNVEKIKQDLAPHLARCRAEGLWVYQSLSGLWFTPDDLEEQMAKGHYIWSIDKWQLIKPSVGLKELRIHAHNAMVEVNKWEEKMRSNGFEVPD